MTSHTRTRALTLTLLLTRTHARTHAHEREFLARSTLFLRLAYPKLPLFHSTTYPHNRHNRHR